MEHRLGAVRPHEHAAVGGQSQHARERDVAQAQHLASPACLLQERARQAVMVVV